MGAFQVFSCLVFVFVASTHSDKRSYFDIAADKRVASGVIGSGTAFSARHCSVICLKSTECMGCNWHEATRACELFGAHAAPVVAPGFTALTREYNVQHTALIDTLSRSKL